MPIVVPGVATNYPGPLKALTSPFARAPSEGNYQIPAEIDWGNMGGADHVVAFNLANSGDTKIISQICSVRVDNSACGSDIQFIFPDSSETVTIPAYEPYVLIPLFTRALSFFVASGLNNQLVESTDFTRFTLFNFVPPPVTVPTSEEQNIVSESNILSSTPSTVLIPIGNNGTLESAYVFFAANVANTGNATWSLMDGTSKIIAQGTINVSAGDKDNLILFNMSGLRVRFNDGLNFNISQSAVLGATLSVALYYRSP